MDDADARAREAGLCANCRFARTQTSAKGQRFWRCGRSDDEPRFARYPPLPVTACPGHEPDAEPPELR